MDANEGDTELSITVQDKELEIELDISEIKQIGNGQEEAPEEEIEAYTVISHGKGSVMSFSADGKFTYTVEKKDVHEKGTWSLKDGKLVIVNSAGREFELEKEKGTINYVSGIKTNAQFDIVLADLPTVAKSSIPRISSGFTNEYGTPTTKCAHIGCNDYIASSGDTACCAAHSGRCADCGKYIDEDAMYCMDCLIDAAYGY